MMSSCGTKPSTVRNVRRLAYRSAPSKRTHPAVAGVTPAIASSRVVLPAPLPPTMATSSPGATLNEAASSNVSSRRSFALTVRVKAWTSMRTPAWRSLGVVATACPYSVMAEASHDRLLPAHGARRETLLRPDETADEGHTVAPAVRTVRPIEPCSRSRMSRTGPKPDLHR